MGVMLEESMLTTILKSSWMIFWISGKSRMMSAALLAGSRALVFGLRTIPMVPPAKRRQIFGRGKVLGLIGGYIICEGWRREVDIFTTNVIIPFLYKFYGQKS